MRPEQRKTLTERLSLGWRMAEAGSSASDFARALGVSAPRVCQGILIHDEALRERFNQNPHGNTLSADEAVWRLKILCGVEARKWTLSAAARALGLTPSSLINWRKRTAPDGPFDCLQDFMDDEEFICFRADMTDMPPGSAFDREGPEHIVSTQFQQGHVPTRHRQAA